MREKQLDLPVSRILSSAQVAGCRPELTTKETKEPEGSLSDSRLVVHEFLETGLAAARESWSALALADLDIEAHDPVLIAERNHRNIARHVVLDLNDLLGRDRDVCAVGDR
jgi:hypothetical protein